MATAPVDKRQRAIIEDRWRMAKIGLIRFSGENGITWTNSKRYYRITETLEEIAALLVEDGVHGDEEYIDDEDSLNKLIGDIWGDIEARMLAWAGREDVRRRRIRAKRLAEEVAS